MTNDDPNILSQFTTLDDVVNDTRSLVQPITHPVTLTSSQCCSECGNGPLLYSCRSIGDGLCHPCGHKKLATARGDMRAFAERVRDILATTYANSTRDIDHSQYTCCPVCRELARNYGGAGHKPDCQFNSLRMEANQIINANQ